jgi:putative ATP-dependent endonuclease of OLD family
MNKRGSGVRRLILLNFFRAEAERRQQQEGVPGVIYAIEEPETSQHPDNQEMLVDALLELAHTESSQVLITTHVPALASRIPCQNLRYITCSESAGQTIEHPPQTEDEEDIFCQKIADALGVLPETRVRVLICVEGPNDIAFLQHISHILHNHDNSIPDLADNPYVAFLPLGGSSLKQWVERKYLKELHKPEIHIYDADDQGNPPYRKQCDDINAASDENKAFLTSKRTMENYLHPDALMEVFRFSILFSDWDNVPELVARKVHEDSESEKDWEELTEPTKKSKISAAKLRLNREAASRMTYERIQQRDNTGEIGEWLRHISSML